MEGSKYKDCTSSKNSAFSEIKLPKISKFEKLKSGEDYNYNSLPKMFKNNPDSVKYSMYEQIKESVGVYGSDRIDYLKQQFRNILENVLPFEIKLSMFMFDKISISKWVRYQRKSRKKYTDNVSTGNPIVDKLLEVKLSTSVVEAMKRHGKDYIKLLNGLKKLISKFVYVRNKIFQCLKEISLFKREEDVNLGSVLNKEDIVKIFELKKTVEDIGAISVNELWNIATKPIDKEFGSDIELSE